MDDPTSSDHNLTVCSSNPNPNPNPVFGDRSPIPPIPSDDRDQRLHHVFSAVQNLSDGGHLSPVCVDSLQQQPIRTDFFRQVCLFYAHFGPEHVRSLWAQFLLEYLRPGNLEDYLKTTEKPQLFGNNFWRASQQSSAQDCRSRSTMVYQGKTTEKRMDLQADSSGVRRDGEPTLHGKEEKKKMKQRNRRARKKRKLGVEPIPCVPHCYFYLNGRCNKGKNCYFSHDVVVPLTNPSEAGTSSEETPPLMGKPSSLPYSTHFKQQVNSVATQSYGIPTLENAKDNIPPSEPNPFAKPPKRSTSLDFGHFKLADLFQKGGNGVEADTLPNKPKATTSPLTLNVPFIFGKSSFDYKEKKQFSFPTSWNSSLCASAGDKNDASEENTFGSALNFGFHMKI